MSSHEQSYKAGEAKGQAQEKTGQAVDTMKDKAQGAKDRVSQGTHDTEHKAGTHMGAAKEKASQMAQSGKETAQAGKEKTGSILQKTGEQVKGMAQGTADAVKHTFGMAEEGEDEDVRKKRVH